MGIAIVVDASVARAAGESGQPLPEACRLALFAIQKHGYRLALSDPVLAEWLKSRPNSSHSYASNFALLWLTQMRSSGRVVDIPLEPNSALRQTCLQALQENPQTSSAAKVVAKDFHLVETALLSDHRILSLDKRTPHHLAHLQAVAPEVCAILWVHPLDHNAANWLSQGAPDRVDCRVC